MKQLSFILLVAFIIGCGGGGGSSTDTTIPLKTSTIRQLLPGDYWHFSVSGTLSVDNQAIPITGTWSDNILTATKTSPVTNDNCLDEHYIFTVTGQGQTFFGDSHSYVGKDASGNALYYGEDTVYAGSIWVSSPAEGYIISMRSPVAVGQNNSGNAAFNDGSTMTYSLSVIAVENVPTPLGVYQSYKVNVSFTNNYISGDNTVVSGTDWYVPGLGIIKTDRNESYYLKGVLQYSLSYIAVIDQTTVVY